jgi:hypothetical protein
MDLESGGASFPARFFASFRDPHSTESTQRGKEKEERTMNPSIQLRKAIPLFLVALACFALLPAARTACQEGCLTNQNTVLGDDALISFTTGTNNTANGFQVLFNNTNGMNNTATGSQALQNNTMGGHGQRQYRIGRGR